ncbi:hypothetical protein ACSNOI_01480 [Actinomadura kijaniata]|uniref:hypothetical protein n=1 Tax=Actinomadura kijaniata TaxID=46161 RepID=UPI003F1B26D5
MPSPDPGALVAGVVITLALFGLIAFIVHRLAGGPSGRPAPVLIAVSVVIAALPAVLVPFLGG